MSEVVSRRYTYVRIDGNVPGNERQRLIDQFFFFFFTLVTGPRRSLSLKVTSSTIRYYPPCTVIVPDINPEPQPLCLLQAPLSLALSLSLSLPPFTHKPAYTVLPI